MTDLFPVSFGGIAIANRIDNTPASIATWLNSTRQRFNGSYPVAYNAAGFPTVGLPQVWVVTDVCPKGPLSLLFLGRVVNPSNAPNLALRTLQNLTDNYSVTTGGQVVVASPLTYFAVASSWSVTMYASVFDNDPMQTVLVGATMWPLYFQPILAKSEYISVQVTDHLGNVIAANGSACAMSEVDQPSLLSTVVHVNVAQSWRVDIGQCPGFQEHSVSYGGYKTKVAVYLSGICAFAFVASACVVAAALWHENDARVRVTLAKHSETERAHRWILGYGTSSLGWL